MMPKLARDVVRLLLVAIVAVAAASLLFEQPLSAVVVSSSAVLAVLGLALQDLLKNIFAGMAMQIEKPFRSGDWLLLDTGLAQVLEMSWRSTRLRTNEGIEIHEPNSGLAAGKVLNHGSGRQPVAFLFRISLPLQVAPDHARNILLPAVQKTPGVAATPTPEVFVEHFGEFALHYKLRVWTHDVGSSARFQDAVQSRLWYALQRHGIELPNPMRTVEIHPAAHLHQARRAQTAHRAQDALAGLSLFRDLSADALAGLAAAARHQHYADGEILVHEGQSGSSLFILEHGHVRVSKSGAAIETSSVELARLKAGDFFGEMSLLTGEPRSATVAADGGCEVLVLERAAVAPVLAADPAIAEALSRALAARVAAMVEKMEDRRERARSAPGTVNQQTLLHRIRSFFSLPDEE